MSTRCLIGVEYDDKSIRYIYCHHDGYLKGVGKMLKEYYTDIDKIEELLSLGNISSLGRNPISKNSTDTLTDCVKRWLTSPNETNQAELEKVFSLSEEYCDAYGGEDEIANCVENRKEYMEQQFDADYRYLFSREKWLVQKGNKKEFHQY